MKASIHHLSFRYLPCFRGRPFTTFKLLETYYFTFQHFFVIKTIYEKYILNYNNMTIPPPKKETKLSNYNVNRKQNSLQFLIIFIVPLLQSVYFQTSSDFSSKNSRIFLMFFLCQLDFITFDTLWRSCVNPFSWHHHHLSSGAIKIHPLNIFWHATYPLIFQPNTHTSYHSSGPKYVKKYSQATIHTSYHISRF